MLREFTHFESGNTLHGISRFIIARAVPRFTTKAWCALIQYCLASVEGIAVPCATSDLAHVDQRHCRLPAAGAMIAPATSSRLSGVDDARASASSVREPPA